MNLNDINYDLEIDRVIKTIKKEKSKRVLLQFPEGLKPVAQEVCDLIESKVKCSCFIWIDSCFGSCDIPLEVERLGIDLIVQFGHSVWNYKNQKNMEIKDLK